MKELKKQHLEMLQLLESIEVMLQNGDSIHPDSVIRGAIQTAIGMDINLNNKKMETTLIIKAKMTDEQLEVLVSEIKKISEIIGIKLTFKSE